MIDLKKAQDVFLEYVKDFDDTNMKIKRKRNHTIRTMNVALKIAEGLNLSKEDIELAGLIGLLHDVGRFNQVKMFDTYNDSISVDHAGESNRVLFEEGRIRDYIETDEYDYIIKTAIWNHNKAKIEDGLDERTLLHAKIIRDADKTDIFEAFMVEESGKGLYNYDEIGKLSISDEVYNYIMNCRQLDRKILKNDLEWFISNLSYTFDYNFTPGLKIIKEKKYIERIISKLTYISDENKMKISEIQGILLNYIDKRLKEE